MTLLIINGTDYTPYITTPSWQVNDTEVTQDWVDGNGVTHRDVIRTKVSGKFNIANRGENSAAFNALVADLAAVRTANNAYTVQAYCDNTKVLKTIEAFISFTPAMTRGAGGPVYVEKFDVSIEER